MSYKVKIELDFDTYKPNAEDIYKYSKEVSNKLNDSIVFKNDSISLKDLFEDNSLDYKLIDNKKRSNNGI